MARKLEETMKTAREKLKDSPKVLEQLERIVGAVAAFPSTEDRRALLDRREAARRKAKETI